VKVSNASHRLFVAALLIFNDDWKKLGDAARR
jgi:hypothetical protein